MYCCRLGIVDCIIVTGRLVSKEFLELMHSVYFFPLGFWVLSVLMYRTSFSVVVTEQEISEALAK